MRPDEELLKISRERKLALNLKEMQVIKEYFLLPAGHIAAIKLGTIASSIRAGYLIIILILCPDSP